MSPRPANPKMIRYALLITVQSVIVSHHTAAYLYNSSFSQSRFSYTFRSEKGNFLADFHYYVQLVMSPTTDKVTREKVQMLGTV